MNWALPKSSSTGKLQWTLGGKHRKICHARPPPARTRERGAGPSTPPRCIWWPPLQTSPAAPRALARALRIVGAAAAEAWEPEPRLTVSQWADRDRRLSQKSAAEPGQWRTSRTPYLRDIMDDLSPSSPVQDVVFAKGAQIGGTEAGNNWLGFIMAHAPGPTMLVLPSLEVAKDISKQRIASLIEESPALREKVKAARSRDSGNTLFTKEFPGGILLIRGANAPAGLRSMPIRYLMGDEVDAWPGDVGGSKDKDGEGDPWELASKRTTTFVRRKKLRISTPTIAGLSRIAAAYAETDQRRFFVPCPHCHEMDWIRWENIRWQDADPSTVALWCTHCEQLIPEHHKTWMLARGEWRATAPCCASSPCAAHRKVRGYHLSGLYSPLGWKSWTECVAEWLKAQGNPQLLKVFVNTVLGEAWEEKTARVDSDTILERREVYPAEVPNRVAVLVGSVDVQDDRLEVLVKGYGAGEESWMIAFTQLRCVAIDSGGHHTDAVYKFCKARVGRRVWAVRGGSSQGREIAGRPTNKNRYHVHVFTLGTDSAKDAIYSRLEIPKPDVPGYPRPGYMHFPDWIDEEYAKQLLSEKPVRRWIRGRGTVRFYEKTRDRNEALDLEVYALAALNILGQTAIRQLEKEAKRVAVPVAPEPETAADAKPEPTATQKTANAKRTKQLRRRNSYVNRWRNAA
jgi:phage terminase large subunit GpA-like protein